MIQINKITNERKDIKTNTNKVQSIIASFFKNLYFNKLKNLEKKIATFLDIQVNHNRFKKTLI